MSIRSRLEVLKRCFGETHKSRDGYLQQGRTKKDRRALYGQCEALLIQLGTFSCTDRYKQKFEVLGIRDEGGEMITAIHEGLSEYNQFALKLKIDAVRQILPSLDGLCHGYINQNDNDAVAMIKFFCDISGLVTLTILHSPLTRVPEDVSHLK